MVVFYQIFDQILFEFVFDVHEYLINILNYKASQVLIGVKWAFNLFSRPIDPVDRWMNRWNRRGKSVKL